MSTYVIGIDSNDVMFTNNLVLGLCTDWLSDNIVIVTNEVNPGVAL